VNAGGKVSGCLIKGIVHDASHVISARDNVLDQQPPKFNKGFVPEAPEYKSAGYRPVAADSVSTPRRAEEGPPYRIGP